MPHDGEREPNTPSSTISSQNHDQNLPTSPATPEEQERRPKMVHFTMSDAQFDQESLSDIASTSASNIPAAKHDISNSASDAVNSTSNQISANNPQEPQNPDIDQDACILDTGQSTVMESHAMSEDYVPWFSLTRVNIISPLAIVSLYCGAFSCGTCFVLIAIRGLAPTKFNDSPIISLLLVQYFICMMGVFMIMGFDWFLHSALRPAPFSWRTASWLPSQ